MASKSVNIKNMKNSIEQGDIPGYFSNNRLEFIFNEILYIARKKTHVWQVKVRLMSGEEYIPITDNMLDQPVIELLGNKAEIKVESHQVGSLIRKANPTYVTSGKNIGKSNATNVITQGIRDALSLHNKQKRKSLGVTDNEKKGEVLDIYDRQPPPMLVKKLGDSKSSTLTEFKNLTLQRKLNGVRCVSYMNDETVVCYSRTGNNYPGHFQIKSELLSMFQNIPIITPGEYGTPQGVDYYKDAMPYIDGEIYEHGVSLNVISGQARRKDDEGKIKLNVYDVFFPEAINDGHNMESRYRQLYLDAFFSCNVEHPNILRVENFEVTSEKQMNQLVKSYISEKYEGGIVRKDNGIYEYGYNNYHSSNLVKIKPILDSEFIVSDFTEGKKGKDKGALIWVCVVPDPIISSDNTFTVVPKNMTYEDRYKLYKCLNTLVEGPEGKMITIFERDIKGLPLTIEYSELSVKTGKPLQAKALIFRTYEDASEDPIKKLFELCDI